MASTSLVSSSPSVWTMVLSLPLMLATASAAHCPSRPCGNVNISFPFGVVPDHATETNSCGVIGLQFQVLCSNNIPHLGSTTYSPRILDIFYHNTSLLVADDSKLDDFQKSSGSSKPCHSPSNNSSAKLGFQFSISPVNQNMIFYNCTEPRTQAVRQSRGLVDTACGDRALVGVTKGPDVPANYFLEGCNATVVPMLARPGEVNPAN